MGRAANTIRGKTRAALTLVTALLVSWGGPAAAQDSKAAVAVEDSTTGRVITVQQEQAGPKVGTVPAPAPPPLVFFTSSFDTLNRRQYLAVHSFSFDHFLESLPGFVLTREGPIGKSTTFSRYGFGSGRATVYLGGIPVNDPQNGLAPLAQFPAGGVGSVVTGDVFAGRTLSPDGLEGGVEVLEAAPPEGRPRTFIEVSKGKNNLRQRRVRFSSADAVFGLDLGYDELLNDGYSFDARQLNSLQFRRGIGYGKSLSRHYTMNLRGRLSEDETYLISFRKFTSNSDGDLFALDAQQRLSGHLASVHTGVGRFKLAFFERGYKTTWPDSLTVNQTTGAVADVRLVSGEKTVVDLGVGFEDIIAKMELNGAKARPKLRQTTARLTAAHELGRRTVGRVQLSGTDQHGLASGWGGSASFSRRAGRFSTGLDLRRAYRMPNLGELFAPAHTVRGGAAVVSGNRYLDGETAWEAGGRFGFHYGGFTSETRLAAVQVDNPVVFARDGGWLVASNGPRERLAVLEERLRLDVLYRGFELNVAGCGVGAGGDREDYFVSVPKRTAVLSARVGRNLFEATSALHFGVEYVYRSGRGSRTGGELPSYRLVNFKVDARLLDANMYMLLINAFDELYQTEEGYLMTPRTFVYGLAWSLFE